MSEVLYEVPWWNWFYLVLAIFPAVIRFLIVIPSFKNKNSIIGRGFKTIGLLPLLFLCMPLALVINNDYILLSHKQSGNYQTVEGRLTAMLEYSNSTTLKIKDHRTNRTVFLDYYDTKNATRCYQALIFNDDVLEVGKDYSIDYFLNDYIMYDDTVYACIFEIRQGFVPE